MSLNLPHLLSPRRIEIIDKIESKKSVLDQLASLLANKQSLLTKYEIFDALVAREKLGSTCIGNGIATPRANINIIHPVAALLIIKKGLDIETVDNIPVKIFLAILIPDNQKETYSTILQKLNLILTEERNFKIFTETNSQEYLANYFESLLSTEIMEK